METDSTSFLVLFPPRKFLKWNIDQHGFWQVQVLTLNI